MLHHRVTEVDNEAWDSFLESTPLGQFQQSSLWARAKGVDGWIPIRRAAVHNGKIVGGFQILARRTRLGRVGYIYKGPAVATAEEEGLSRLLIGFIAETARQHDLRAVVVQPPDESSVAEAIWTEAGFIPNHLVSLIKATLVVDLSPGLERVRQHIRRTTRAEIRQSVERGVTVRLGTEQDLAAFFALMAATCERQRTTPSPSGVEALRAVWSAFHPQDKVKLFVAEHDGEPVAGLLCLCFGRRVVAWKRGWSGAKVAQHPNQRVTYEAIQWAGENGFSLFDFEGLDRGIALALLAGEPLSMEQKKSRHFVNLAFGNQPRLLPASKVFVDNPFLRGLCGLAGHPAARRLLRRG